MAVEIQLSLMDDTTSDEEEPPVYRRKVLIPVRPLDLVALADPNDPIFGSRGGKDSEKEEGEDKKGKDGSSSPGDRYTNADCFPDSLPASAPSTANLCLTLAPSAPGMRFKPKDYQGMPEDCKPIVNPKCR